MGITVRPATEDDAPDACEVLRRSIRELCIVDHRNDPEVLADWLKNKTPENVRAWIASADNFCVVAVRGTDVCGVALLYRDGEVRLCYLVPEVRFLGVGKLMLQALEQQARRWRLDRVFLTSTLTAKPFYERNSYNSNGGAVLVHGVQNAFLMAKAIAL